MLFDYQLDTSGDYNTSTGTVKKLVPNFVDKKKKYVLYYKNLQLYLGLGLKIKKYIVY